MVTDSGSSPQFADRHDAGQQLAAELQDHGVEADLVLAIPRGGLPLGREVADVLDCPLDVVVASKIGAPGNPELAIGAVASDGSAWLAADTIKRLGVDQEYIDRERDQEATVAREKAERYRDGGALPDVEGKRVVVVDDGVATGSTAKAALRQVQAADAEHVVLAVPVGPPETITELDAEADQIVCIDTPSSFGAVGRFYDRFDQVSDEEAISFLDEDST